MTVNFNFLLAVIVICLTVMFIADVVANAYIESHHSSGLDEFLKEIARKSREKDQQQGEVEEDE